MQQAWPAPDVARSNVYRDPAQRSRTLIEAAASLFSEHGYRSTTAREIGDRAGCSPALIKRYFGGKHDLLLAVLDDASDTLLRGASLGNSSLRVEDDLTSLLISLSESLAQFSDAFRVLVVHSLYEDAATGAAARTHNVLVDRISMRLREQESAGRIACDREAVASLLFGLTFHFALGLILSYLSRDELRSCARRYARILANGINTSNRSVSSLSGRGFQHQSREINSRAGDSEGPWRNKDRRSRELIEAATQVFAERGYASATTAEIAQRAGCTEPLIGFYFGGKRGLLEAVIEYNAAQIAETTRALKPLRDLSQEIRQLFASQIALVQNQVDYFRVTLEQAFLDPIMRASLEQLALDLETSIHTPASYRTIRPNLLAEIMRPYQRSGQIKEDVDIADAAMLIVVMSHYIAFQSTVIWQESRSDSVSLARWLPTS